MTQPESPQNERKKKSQAAIVVLFLLGLGTLISFQAWGQTADSPGPGQNPDSGVVSPDTADIPAVVTQHCSGCHKPPPAEAMTRDSWPNSISSMLKFMAVKGLFPPEADVTRVREYFQTKSPRQFTQIPDDLEPSKLQFRKIAAGNPAKHEKPQITNLNVTDLDRNGLQDFLVTDNLNSSVSWVQYDPETDTWPEIKLAEAPAPVRTAVFDFEGDGDLDIAVAAMGFMHPNDHLIGEVHLLLNDGKQNFKTVVLMKNTARVTDVRPGDFDGDGDIDFAVAMFGWRTTGAMAWLEQVSATEFRYHELVKLNGFMHLHEHDFGNDGNLDFLALITQEHESIVEFRNAGRGLFTSSIVASASHPAFGSSGIHPVDFDQDGDLDILYTNGDIMDDDPVPKPYHGVRWFENDGGRYQLRELARMPGCYGAVAHDMDGDGDLDAVVSSLYFHWQEHDFPSLIWLENDGTTQNFTRRRIDYAPTNLASIDVGDLNGDAIPDIVGGGMHVPGPADRAGRITVWLGQPPVSENQ